MHRGSRKKPSAVCLNNFFLQAYCFSLLKAQASLTFLAVCTFFFLGIAKRILTFVFVFCACKCLKRGSIIGEGEG